MPKSARDQFRALPLEFPGIETVSLPSRAEPDQEYSCASVYVATPRRGGVAAGLFRVNLFASLFGIRRLVASAFVPLNFTGHVISAAGILADSFDVYVQASDPTIEIFVALRADTCCATPGVLVPVELQNPGAGNAPAPEFATLIQENPAPLQVETGLYELRSEDTDPGLTVTIAEGQRVLSVAARASGVAVGTVEIDTQTFAAVDLEIEPGESLAIDPKGALVGPATITFSNVIHFIVETVR